MAIDRPKHLKAIGYAKFLFEYARIQDIPLIVYSKLSGKSSQFRLKDGTVTRNINGPFFMALPYKRQLVDEANLLYEWNVGGKTIFATDMQIGDVITEFLVLGEFDRNYGVECSGARVLDIGGFIGDTAMYFLGRGASKVTIYEPVPENILAMRRNLAVFGNRVEIVEGAAGESEGEITLSSASPPGRIAFGVTDKGEYSLNARCFSFPSIIASGKFDLAKVDCEGCEVALLGIDPEILSKIPAWIIEVHKRADWEKFTGKFREAGFRMVNQVGTEGTITILHFKK